MEGNDSLKEYFKFKETSNIGWTFCPTWDEFWTEGQPINGSFALVACRVSGLSWPQWLRFCRQNGATLYGKNHKYVVPIWKEPNKEFEKMMNERANKLAQLINFKELHL